MKIPNLRLLILTGLSRVISALGGLVFTIAVGRIFGAEVLGQFVFANSIVLLLVMAAKFGGDRDLIKFNAIHWEASWSALRLARLRRACLISACISMIAITVLWIVAALIDEPRTSMLVVLAPAVFFMSWMWLNAGFLKGMSYPHIGTLFENGIVSAVAAIILFFCALGAISTETTLTASYVTAGLLVWTISLVAVLFVNHRVSDDIAVGQAKAVHVERSGLAFAMIDMTNFLISSGSFIVGAFVLTSHEIGLLRGAERASVLIVFILSVTNVIVAPRIARSFASANHDQLVSAGQWAVRWNVILASPVVVICMVYPSIFVEMFGPEFSGIEPFIRIMGAGHLINVVSGPCAMLLAMTDYAALAVRINIISLAISMALYIIFSTLYGPTGFAVAYAVSIVVRNGLMLVAVKTKLRLWYLPRFGF